MEQHNQNSNEKNNNSIGNTCLPPEEIYEDRRAFFKWSGGSALRYLVKALGVYAVLKIFRSENVSAGERCTRLRVGKAFRFRFGNNTHKIGKDGEYESCEAFAEKHSDMKAYAAKYSDNSIATMVLVPGEYKMPQDWTLLEEGGDLVRAMKKMDHDNRNNGRSSSFYRVKVNPYLFLITGLDVNVPFLTRFARTSKPMILGIRARDFGEGASSGGDDPGSTAGSTGHGGHGSGPGGGHGGL